MTTGVVWGIVRFHAPELSQKAPESEAEETGDEASEEEITEEMSEKARIKRENHARFMRFSRSLKSSFDRTHVICGSKYL